MIYGIGKRALRFKEKHHDKNIAWLLFTSIGNLAIGLFTVKKFISF